jgi:HAD superfamily hydrolase (TIGR01484 family)
MTKPVLCFDFDGTLVDGEGHIHPRDVALLRENTRAHFLPATGRPLHAVRRAFVRNGLSWPAIPFPLVLQNGAVVFLPGEKLFVVTPLYEDEQGPLVEACRRRPRVCSILFSLDGLHVMYPNAEGERMIRRFDLDVRPFDPDAPRSTYTKITCISDSAEEISALAADMALFAVEASFSLPTVFELTRRGIDKGQMLRRLLTALGLEGAPLAVAGDGENDLPLFAIADRTYCPQNAPAAVRQKADVIVDVADGGILEPMLRDFQGADESF